MRKIIISLALVSLMLICTVEVFALNQNNTVTEEFNDNILPLPSGNGLMQRLHNRI